MPKRHRTTHIAHSAPSLWSSCVLVRCYALAPRCGPLRCIVAFDGSQTTRGAWGLQSTPRRPMQHADCRHFMGTLALQLAFFCQAHILRASIQKPHGTNKTERSRLPANRRRPPPPPPAFLQRPSGTCRPPGHLLLIIKTQNSARPVASEVFRHTMLWHLKGNQRWLEGTQQRLKGNQWHLEFIVL